MCVCLHVAHRAGAQGECVGYPWGRRCALAAGTLAAEIWQNADAMERRSCSTGRDGSYERHERCSAVAVRGTVPCKVDYVSRRQVEAWWNVRKDQEVHSAVQALIALSSCPARWIDMLSSYCRMIGRPSTNCVGVAPSGLVHKQSRECMSTCRVSNHLTAVSGAPTCLTIMIL